MLTFQRTIYDLAPAVIEMPLALRQRRVEVIILALDEPTTNGAATATDANGWPVGFAERTYGSIPDFPDRAPQGEYEIREEFEP